MKETFEMLRAQMRDDKKSTVDGVMVAAGLQMLEQFLGDVHRIADALERIADVQDGTNDREREKEYRERTGKSWVP